MTEFAVRRVSSRCTVRRTLPLTSSARAVVIAVKSPRVCHTICTAGTPPEPKAAGSASIGPYVVKESVRTPRPSSGSSRQYRAYRSTGRYVPVTRTRSAPRCRRSVREITCPVRTFSAAEAASGSATGTGPPSAGGPGRAPSVMVTRARSSVDSTVRSGSTVRGEPGGRSAAGSPYGPERVTPATETGRPS
ncbi:hypothetical protein [Actinacidiphila glaucinigra]